MKVVLLAGGLGSRLAEETQVRPKPMVEIGGQPILWHIMMGYAHHGLTDFILCLGYKGYVIKEYLRELHPSPVRPRRRSGDRHDQPRPRRWRARLAGDPGRYRHRYRDRRPAEASRPPPRSRRAVLHDLWRRRGRRRYRPPRRLPPRAGLRSDGDRRSAARPVRRHSHRWRPGDPLRGEAGRGGRINGGFFVLEPRVIDRIAGDETTWEAEPLAGLAADGQLAAFRHEGFWQPMDTLRDTHASGGPVGKRQPAVEDLVIAARGPDPDFWRGRRDPDHRPYRLQGRVGGLVAAPARRRGPWFRTGARRRARTSGAPSATD